MKQAISMRWLADPNQGHSHFPHDFQSSYDNLIHYQSEESCSHLVVIYVSPIMLTIKPRMVSNFEHMVQSL